MFCELIPVQYLCIKSGNVQAKKVVFFSGNGVIFIFYALVAAFHEAYPWLTLQLPL